MQEEQKLETYHPNYIKKNIKIIIVSSIIIILLISYLIVFSAGSNFPTGTIYDLKSGQTLSIVSNNFYKFNIVKSKLLFKSFVYIFSFGKADVKEGDYSLYKKQGVITLAWRVTHGVLNIVPIRITIPEGLNSFEIADILSNNFPSFNINIFLNLVKTQKLEGYLFPDTYFIMPNMKESEIIKMMTNNYYEKIIEVSEAIKKFGKSESDVVKMASIIEEEGRTMETRQIIAGILWKRLSIKMALQVDASFKYINGKITENLTADDLKIDSPYNSYANRGLPPTAISNPGLEAIKATITPTKTPYFYFLTDKDGNMHYAVSFEEHVANKQKYLR